MLAGSDVIDPTLFTVLYYKIYGQMLLSQLIFSTGPCSYRTMWFSRVSPPLMLKGYYLDVIYFSFSSGDLTNTTSHICCSWYLPIFLSRDGSLTLISTASLMVLAMFRSSLPTMLKLSRDTSWPVMLKWPCTGDGALICSLNFQQILCLTPLHIIFFTYYPTTLISVNHSTLL